jgi:hypothetical protein
VKIVRPLYHDSNRTPVPVIGLASYPNEELHSTSRSTAAIQQAVPHADEMLWGAANKRSGQSAEHLVIRKSEGRSLDGPATGGFETACAQSPPAMTRYVF